MIRLTLSSLALLAAPVFAQTEPTAAAKPAKPEMRRICSEQAFTGGLIKKQKICRSVRVAAVAPVASAEPTPAVVPATQ
jgi:hypothetical protein